MKFNPKFIEEIRQFKTIYCLVSGGYHSTVSALLLKDYGFKNVILLNNVTFLEEPFSLKIIKQVQKITQYPLLRVKPNLKQRPMEILRESFELWRVEYTSKVMGTKRNDYRDKLPCCRKLKKSPAKKWYNKNCTEKDVILSSLCAFEGGVLSNRYRRLKELRDLNTFVRFHITKGVFYIYPWRDYTRKQRERDFYYYLISKGIMPEHSGCVCCPIRVARMIKQNKFYNCPDLRLYCKINTLDITDFIGKGIQKTLEGFIES